MFSHASVSRGPIQPRTAASPQARAPHQLPHPNPHQRPGAVRAEAQAPAIRPRSPTGPAPRSTVSKSNYTRTPDSSVTVAERYTNRAYNRQPSPPSRFSRPVTVCEERPREKVNRLLEACGGDRRQPTVQRRAAERSGSTGSLTSHRVLVTVKDVLSRAVLERGKIDEDNLGTIIKNMKSRLFGEECPPEDDVRPSIDIEMKESRMTVNIEVSSEALPVKRERPTVGIVRRQVTDPPPRVHRPELPAARAVRTLPDGDEVVYIDLPDADYSNFSSLMRKDKERSSRANVSKDSELVLEERSRNSEREITRKDKNINDNPYNDHPVGDWYPTDVKKASEDARLQRYIETLIQNMNDQLTGKRSCGNIEAEIDNKSTICKTFCLCKVCVSNSPSSKKASRESKLSIETIRADDVEVKTETFDSDTVDSNTVSPVRPKPTSTQIPKKTSTLSNVRVVRKSSSPCDSKGGNRAVRAVAYPSRADAEPKESYTVVEPGQTEESADDLYLQRRLRSSARRR